MPQPGEFWLADIPFTNGAASKLRPVLVLWTDAADVVVAAVTSAPPRSKTDAALQEWKGAGLRVPSTVRLSRLDCLEQLLLRRRLGVLAPFDAGQLKRVWASEIQLRPLGNEVVAQLLQTVVLQNAEVRVNVRLVRRTHVRRVQLDAEIV